MEEAPGATRRTGQGKAPPKEHGQAGPIHPGSGESLGSSGWVPVADNWDNTADSCDWHNSLWARRALQFMYGYNWRSVCQNPKIRVL